MTVVFPWQKGGSGMRNDRVFRHFPRPVIVKDHLRKTAFGGDQEWFSGYTARLSGCGPVAVANVFATLAATSPVLARAYGVHPSSEGHLPLADYCAFMEDVYASVGTREIRPFARIVDRRREEARQLMAAGGEENIQKAAAILRSPLTHLLPSLGNSISSLKRGVLRYAQKVGTPLQWNQMRTHRAKWDAALAFIEEGLCAGVPVLLLTSLSRHDLFYHEGTLDAPPRLNTDTLVHFMTIVAVVEDSAGSLQLLLSDAGKLARIPYDHLHASWASPLAAGGALSWFSPAPLIFRNEVLASLAAESDACAVHKISDLSKPQ